MNVSLIILGYLRRSLSQQASVRERLYIGLCELATSTQLDDVVFDLLAMQV